MCICNVVCAVHCHFFFSFLFCFSFFDLIGQTNVFFSASWANDLYVAISVNGFSIHIYTLTHTQTRKKMETEGKPSEMKYGNGNKVRVENRQCAILVAWSVARSVGWSINLCDVWQSWAAYESYVRYKLLYVIRCFVIPHVMLIWVMFHAVNPKWGDKTLRNSADSVVIRQQITSC